MGVVGARWPNHKGGRSANAVELGFGNIGVDQSFCGSLDSYRLEVSCPQPPARGQLPPLLCIASSSVHQIRLRTLSNICFAHQRTAQRQPQGKLGDGMEGGDLCG